MTGRLQKLGIVLTVFGLLFFAGAAYAYIKVQDGQHSLAAFSAAQNVRLTYNEQGQLTDHGTADGAVAIMALLNNEWGYATNPADFDPNDPVVNTPSEYMFQMAAITEHTLTSTVTVTLPEDVTAADGTVYKAGTYDFPVNGKYYADFDRTNPIEAQARTIAWSPLALSLIGQLGVGAVTASSLQMGIGLAGLFAAVGFVFIVAGLGLVWAVRPETHKVPVLHPAMQPA
jgi:YD repeat-containing protein